MEETKYEKIKETKEKKTNERSLIYYIIIGIPFIISFLIALFLLLKIKPIDLIKKKEDGGFIEKWYDYYGIKFSNLSYSIEKKIKNSFANGEEHYDSNFEDINNNKDYNEISNNIYDMYIPYSAIEKKEETNGIIFWIHGGFFLSGKKSDIESFCIRYAKLGYITVNIELSLLKGKNQHNIFKLMDEIDSVILISRQKLKEIGITKLKGAIGGYSSGGYLSLLYYFLIGKKSPIKIHFIINLAGFLSINPKNIYLSNNALNENLNKDDINNLIKNKTLISFNYHIEWLKYMNGFIGSKYKETNLNDMLIKNKINENNNQYKELSKIINKTDILSLINNDEIGILSLYGGMDKDIGVLPYFYLKDELNKKGIKNDFVYMKNSTHTLYPENEEDLNKTRSFHTKILSYAKKYLR